MGNINDINEFEKYLEHKQKADTFSFYGILLFLAMGIAIVAFAIKYKDCKDQVNKNNALIKELQDEKTKGNAEIKLTLDSLRQSYNLKMDSIKNSFTSIDSINKSSLKFQKEHYEELLKLADINLKRVNATREVRTFEIEKIKVKEEIEFKEASNSTKIEKVIVQANIEKIETKKYSLFIQYMTKRKNAAINLHRIALNTRSNSDVKIIAPQEISYDFKTVVKYYYDQDRNKACSIAAGLGYNCLLEKSKYDIPLGQIEIWLGIDN